MCCMCREAGMNRRQFMGATALGVTAAGLGLSTAAGEEIDWNPERPYSISGARLVVQPLLVAQLHNRREATSWRPWGGLHDESDIDDECNRIRNELKQLAAESGGTVEILPLEQARDPEAARRVRERSRYDVLLLYPASGSSEILEASVREGIDTIVFLRHRSGPIYLWYEILHNRFLRKGGGGFELDRYRNPGGVTVDDVAVDDPAELSWRLRALYGVKNFIGQRILALGGSGGWCFPEAPQVAKEKFNLDIVDVPYDDLAARISAARADRRLSAAAGRWADTYLRLPATTLETSRPFLERAFVLNAIFKQMMADVGTNAFTIQGCMSTVIPMAETTACLPLSLLNDEGQMAFCESDFNVIPSGILLYYIARKPVFLNDPTFPHDGLVTCAHCTAPRRMDGVRYAPARVMTHFESDYGATPKVDLPSGTQVTMICPDSRQVQWLGFTGRVIASPLYDICRSQYDITIDGDWGKLLRDHRGFHWMMAVGDFSRELAYGCRKTGIEWVNVSRA